MVEPSGQNFIRVRILPRDQKLLKKQQDPSFVPIVEPSGFVNFKSEKIKTKGEKQKTKKKKALTPPNPRSEEKRNFNPRVPYLAVSPPTSNFLVPPLFPAPKLLNPDLHHSPAPVPTHTGKHSYTSEPEKLQFACLLGVRLRTYNDDDDNIRPKTYLLPQSLPHLAICAETQLPPSHLPSCCSESSQLSNVTSSLSFSVKKFGLFSWVSGMHMATEIETVEQRLKSFLGQLLTERGILERIVYKHKNQHRRCSYFQYVLKVQRDLNLLKSVNLEEILDASFLVINGNKPKQKVQLLESLKRRRCDGGKYSFLERLLGAARLLPQMVEPLLRAAMYPFILFTNNHHCGDFLDIIGSVSTSEDIVTTMLLEISTLLAQSFFMKFSLTALAVLARIRVLVQQVLVDAVHVYNYVSSLSQREHTIKLNQEGFEVFREYYPRKVEATVALDCIWQVDKYVLVEKTEESEYKSQEKDDQEDVLIKPSNIQYDNIEAFLGVDESGPIDVELVSAEPSNGEESTANHLEKQVQNDSHSAGSSCLSSVSHESETCGEKLMEYGPFAASCSAAPLVKPMKHRSPKKKNVAYLSVNPKRTPSTVDQPKVQLRGTGRSGEDHCGKSQDLSFFSNKSSEY